MASSEALSSNPMATMPSHSRGITRADPDTIHKQQTQHLEGARRQQQFGHGPLAQVLTNTSTEYYPAFGGDFQPGLYKPPDKKYGNPAPMALSGFALTTFLLSLLNLNVKGSHAPNIIVGPAIAYGGFVQLLGGMWEIALGNTFGGTALSSYGAFWISLGIIFIPGGFDIAAAYGGATPEFYYALGLYIYGWMLFTILMWLLTLRSTVAFSSLFLTVWLAFLMLGTAYTHTTVVDGATVPNAGCTKAGGVFGIIAAFIAWWAMLAGLLDKSNSFFLVPVMHFPWSEKGRQRKAASIKYDEEKAL